MKHILKFLAVLLMVVSSAASADGPYYVSNCDSGADPLCKPGDDARNDGLSPDTPFRSFARIQGLIDGTTNGRTIRLAKGAKWISAVPLRISVCNGTRCSPSNPLVIEAYTPSWGSGKRWNMEFMATDINGLKFEDGGDYDLDRGYVVRDGRIQGPGMAATRAGVYMFNGVEDAILENMEIDRWTNGIYLAGANNPAAGETSNGMPNRIILRNNEIHDNKDMGIMASCNYCVIEKNYIHDNGFGTNVDSLYRNHNIYFNGSKVAGVDTVNTGVRIIGNRLERSAVCTAATAPNQGDATCASLGKLNKCDGTSLVVHGRHQNLVIEDNIIDETPGATGGCYGIQVDGGYNTEAEWFDDVVIRGNKLINVGSNGISVSSAPYVTIESNEVIYTYGSTTFQGIVVPDHALVPNPNFHAADEHAVIRQNTVYINGTAPYNIGIVASTPGTGLGQRVFNNLIVFGPNARSGVACYKATNMENGNFSIWDYNQCYSAGALPKVNYTDAAAGLFSAWNGAGFDTHGIFGADPKIDTPSSGNNYSVKPNDAASSVRNAGHPTLSKRLGIRGQVNPDAIFTGANPYHPTLTAPSSPTTN